MIDRVLDWVERNYLRATLIVLAAFVILIGMVFASLAKAATLTGSFTLPTQYEDGSPLPVANIKHIRVQVGTCSVSDQVVTGEGEQLVAPPATAFSVTVPRAFGRFCARAQTETVSGLLSAWTPSVVKVIAEPAPKPPTLLTIASIAYELRQYNNGTLRFVQVGTVPLGAECSTRLAGDYAAFDGAKLTKPTQGGIIAARCAPASDG